MRKINLQGTDFKICDFTGANLTGANVEDTEFFETIGLNLEGTVGTPRRIVDPEWLV